MRTAKTLITVALAFTLSSCATTSNVLNPFYEPPTETALGGQPNDHALNEGAQKIDSARQALDAMNTYQASHLPTPNKPVYNAPVVRVVWVPDHLDRNGNLVAAHYRYVEVKDGGFAASDAFEVEKQLGAQRGGSNISYALKDDVRGR